MHRVEIRIRVALTRRSITAISCGVHKLNCHCGTLRLKTNVWPYWPIGILFQHNMRLGCSVIPPKIVSHVKLMYLHSVPISWRILLVISWLNYLLFPTSATHNIIESTREVGRKVTSWTLTVHKAWRQIIPAKNYTPETKYNLKWRSLPTTYETGHTTLELSHNGFSGPNLCTPCSECALDNYWGSITRQLIFIKATDCEPIAGTFPRHLVFHALIIGKPWESRNHSQTCKLVLTMSCKVMSAFAAINFATTSTWPFLDA